MLTIKKTKNRNFYTVPRSMHMTVPEIIEHYRSGEVTLLSCDEYKELLAMLEHKQLNKDSRNGFNKTIQGDTKLLSRILRNGGLINYTEKLEAAI